MTDLLSILLFTGAVVLPVSWVLVCLAASQWIAEKWRLNRSTFSPSFYVMITTFNMSTMTTIVTISMMTSKTTITSSTVIFRHTMRLTEKLRGGKRKQSQGEGLLQVSSHNEVFNMIERKEIAN